MHINDEDGQGSRSDVAATTETAQGLYSATATVLRPSGLVVQEGEEVVVVVY